MTDSADVRVGLVGYGLGGRSFHAPLLRAAEGVRLTHVSTSDAGRAAEAVADQPDVTVVPTFDDLVAAWPAYDLVVVSSPSGVHVEQGLVLVKRGIPVVMDKPLGAEASAARALVESAAELGVPFTVFQNRRWDPEHLTAKALVQSGVLGDVVRYEARFERWQPVPKSRWRENLPTEEGGGILMDLQSHLVDQAVDLFGPVEAVYAEMRSVTTVSDDVTFLALRHAGGVHSHLSATSLAGAAGPRTRILGSEATYLVAEGEDEPTAYDSWRSDGEDHRGWLVRGDDSEPVPRAPGGWGDFYPAAAAMVRDGAPPPVDPMEAVAVLEVLDAARHSAREGVRVPLP